MTLPSVHNPGTPPAVVDRQSAQHYTWGDGNDGWHLSRSSDLSIIYERMAPNTQEISHHHERATQYFHVIEGVLTMCVGDDRLVLHAGQGVSILPGARHQARNETNAAIEFLVVSAPPSHGDRVNAD
ncbi:mannose-6-phosphate isomerase-like protein (cupin superfamily) [Phenylobacterium haematophilum]|uniref:Mannose-6-phosphate isomerase-like protein (Cupin superfamily) n=1 Tax=Phenylobacterium haematophilum TaxID=98513 RepID=A0A839ZVS7_9CAUL|nr:cupin domain-containing protein [Phenylobacterium haematophilum]MBB3890595.1 mannose-6-phosphate isomerase-like protein (cupin superfamily) [Phenylobacterium haematophilum]